MRYWLWRFRVWLYGQAYCVMCGDKDCDPWWCPSFCDWFERYK